MRTLGETWDRDAAGAAHAATDAGFTLARELRAQGVDFSFTPVLDLDHGASAVIGDRAFHRNPNAVAHLASALLDGLHAGGMAGVGKHFPGHGFVAADSHTDVPVDARSYAEIATDDLVPFGALVRRGLEAIMPAHVVYPALDPVAAGFSRKWIREILRDRLGFDGLVVSDDLGMAGAEGVGDLVARAEASVTAGCDMVLACNDFAGADDLLARWRRAPDDDLARRAAAMEGHDPASNAQARP
jgi:beta-N-acetylhexosaminidase